MNLRVRNRYTFARDALTPDTGKSAGVVLSGAVAATLSRCQFKDSSLGRLAESRASLP
jgi:hypothetical protein